jgi:hypothetical protein
MKRVDFLYYLTMFQDFLTSCLQFFRRNIIKICVLLILSQVIHPFDDRNLIYIARTEDYAKCGFPDGSYFEFKSRYKWLFYAEMIPHAQTMTYFDARYKYVDRYSRVQENIGFIGNGVNPHSACQLAGKIGEVAFSADAFQDNKGRWHQFVRTDEHGRITEIKKYPKKIATTSDNQEVVMREFLKKNYLFANSYSFIFPLDASANSLLFEQPLTAFNHPSLPSDTVLYVYQSTSSDSGKTWTNPVITAKAKLFEIGKETTKQSWSAAVKDCYVRSIGGKC